MTINKLITIIIIKNMPQKIKGIKTMSFVDTVKALTEGLPERSQEILFDRYGMSSGKKLTLEGIGKKFSITRERVRQIVKEACKKVKAKKENPLFEQAGNDIVFAAHKNDGIIEEEKLLVSLGGEDLKEQGAVKFFLDCLDSVKQVEIKGELERSFILSDFNLNTWKDLKQIVIETLTEIDETIKGEKLYMEVEKKEVIKGLKKEKLFNYIAVSSEVKKNNFNKWGLSVWKEITPKGTREKSYLVLKELNEPMHFREIAKKIDEYGLGKRKTHPQTVHNELIKDNKFVLVGRGIYALSKWGYKKGTVKEVLEEILSKNPNGLSREDVTSEVLKVRKVKKSTVIINLNNYFKKNKEGMYFLKK